MMNFKKLIITISILLLFNSCLTMGSYLERQYINISDDVLPSVVEVISIGLKSDNENRWFDYFKDQEENLRENFDSNGIGSGVIIESKGHDYYILTNNHVVGDLDEVTILLYDKSLFKGKVIGRDDRLDLAVVKISTTRELKIAKLNIKGGLKVGQFVAALGSPMGYVQSISMGVISNLGRFGGPKGNISNFIQTDASINQGNSGGPLVNLKGEVIGINTWISSPSGGSVGLGFSMPIKNLYPSFRSIVDNGGLNRSWTGISTGLKPNTNYYNSLDGAFIYQVVEGSPAYEFGIKPGDIVTNVNNNTIKSSQELILILSLLQPNDTVSFTIIRSLGELQIDLQLDKASTDILAVSKKVTPGFIVKEDNDGLLIIEVLSKSVAQASGFRKDDKIKSINSVEINKIQDLYKMIKKGSNKIIITREDKELELELNY